MIAEDELLQRARAGEEDAFADLVRLYEQRLRAYARSMVRDDQDAEDLTQEAFFRIYRAIPLFQEQSSFSTWAFRIMNHICLDHLRQRKRRPVTAALTEEMDLPGEKGGTTPDPEDLCLQGELRSYLRGALQAVPAEQRMVVVLHDVCSFKYREIAAISGCSVGTVKSRLFAARVKLRSLLGLAGIMEEGRP